MDRKRKDELQFRILLALGDRERNQDEIHNRMVDLFRVSASRRVPGMVDSLRALVGDGLIERLDNGPKREDYLLTAAGHQACRDEIDLRYRELDAIDKEVRRWRVRSVPR